MATPRQDATVAQRLKLLEDKVRRPALQPTVNLAAAPPAVVAKNSLLFDTSDGNAPSYWDGQAWVPVRDGAIAVAQSTADTALAEAGSDGIAPSTSPVPMAIGGIGYLILKFTPITNADPVTYEAHVSTTSGFTADSTTLVGETTASQFMVKALPGSPPADPSDPDPRVLDPDATYYAVIIAKDADGAAAQSAEVACTAFRVTGVDLEVDSVTAANIVTGTLTGDLFSASVVVSGTFKTADTGQRVQFGVEGILGYKSDGSLMISLPTGTGDALIDAEIIAQGLTVVDGASLYGDSELNADSTLTLQSGITQPSTNPQIGVTYDSVQPSTTALASGSKTGSLGTFDFVASEVSCIEWRTTLGCFSMFQVRPGGTREWYIDNTGAPVNVSGVGYFLDWVDWEIWSATELLGTGTPAKNGHYLMFRYIPSGSDYYCLAANGVLFRYSRQNGVAPPVMGNNGADVFVAEVITGSHLSIRYFVLTGGGSFPAPMTAYESTTGYTATNALACCINQTFDVGTRYLTSERNSSNKARMLVTSGTNANSIFPGGTSNNWASANIDAETFEAPNSNRRAMAFDGTNIWSLHGDGFLYQHTNEHWDPVVSSSLYWGVTTYYDDVGTAHETTPSKVANYTGRRRSKNNFLIPPLSATPGADEPDKVRLYMARGATLPANSSFHLQYTGNTNTTWTTMAAVTASPPTSNSFPGATPAEIKNAAGTLSIKADASIAAVSLAISGAMTKGGNAVAVEGPYYYAWCSSVPAVASGTISTVTGYTVLASSGITVSSGVFTLPRAGRYRIYGQLYWGIQATPTGDRLVQWVQNGSTTVCSGTVAPSSISLTMSAATTTIVAAANDTVLFRFRQQSGGPAGPSSPTARDLDFIVIEYIGA